MLFQLELSRRDLLEVLQLRVGPMENFVYVLFDPASKSGIVIDSGWEIAPMVKAAKDKSIRVDYVVATHHHFDHAKTLGQAASAFSARTGAFVGSPLDVEMRFSDGDSILLGTNTVRVLHTPGHTTDSICLFDGRHLFTGDTLFVGSCGRTDLPGGSVEDLYRSLHVVLSALPGDSVIYPGHDYGEVPYRPLGVEASSNPTLQAASLSEFRKLFSST